MPKSHRVANTQHQPIRVDPRIYIEVCEALALTKSEFIARVGCSPEVFGGERYSEPQVISKLPESSFYSGFTDSRLVTPPPNIKEDFLN
jgi:hypothetical protein